MSNYYELTKSVRITTNGPIDGDRYIAQTISERDNLINIDRAHEGLQVYVKDSINDGSTPLIPKLYILINLGTRAWREISLDGGGDKYLEYDHPSLSNMWTIDHTLGKNPSVTVVGLDNKEIESDIEFFSISRIIIRFNAPFAGKAFLN